METLGGRIRQAIGEADLDIPGAAARLSKNKTTLINWIADVNEPRVSDLVLLAKVTGKDVGFFLEPVISEVHK